ncbi:cytochrome P450 1A1 [Lingula anatina]|uniref:Steroid 21-hydroxylase n=1 Tax=Lingula anatina TaxID=7574 RepID=A0A1S3IDC4_LINAN|nr:cytochrome P450 1A1 [Lingula anatina]|eukprot:XP_013395439.1 cytochrome P450 1A1 [Lingula anatina]
MADHEVLYQAIVTALIVGLSSSIIFRLWKWYRIFRLLPPGPWGWPFIGYLPKLKTNRHLVLTELRKTYGDVYCLKIGVHRAVVLNGLETVRHALVQLGENFAGRPSFHTFQFIENGKSMAFCDVGPRWKVRRTIALNGLHAFLKDKVHPVEIAMTEEAIYLVETFLGNSGKPFNPENSVYLSLGSITFGLCFSDHTLGRSDAEYLKLIKSVRDFTQNVAACNLVDILPWLRYLWKDKLKSFIEVNNTLQSILSRQEREHLATFEEGHVRDILDSFIKTCREMNEEIKQEVQLKDEHITNIAADLLRAGTVTVSVTLTWALLYMIMDPKIQERLQNEVDDVIGPARNPRLDDMGSLPYTEAFILETLRKSSIAPLSLPHATTKDTTLYGYHIPRGTWVIPNLFSISHDEKFWTDPHVFRPERFLTPENTVDETLAKSFLPFSAGKRRCLGELQARWELFLFVATVVQRCHFEKVPGEKYDLAPEFGLVLHPKHFNIIAKSR